MGSTLPLADSTDGLVYKHAAEQWLAGRGWTTPYVWQFLSDPVSLEPPAFGYWMPLASFLLAGSLGLFGDHVLAALLPSILGVAVLTGLGYALAFRLTRDRSSALLAAALIPLHPWVVRWGLSSQAALASAVFGSAALWLTVSAAGSRPLRLVGAGALAGLAALSRGDGVLILGCACLGICALAWSRRAGIVSLLGEGVALATGFAAAMGPWYLRNVAVFGSPTPPGASRALFIRSPEQLYSVQPPDLAVSLAALREAPVHEAVHKVLAVARLVENSISDAALMIPLAALRALACWRTRKLPVLALGLGYLGVLIAFYGGIATEIGEASTRKSSLTCLPFWAGAVAAGAASLEDRRKRLVVLVVMLCAMGVAGTRFALKVQLRRDVDYAWIERAIGDERPVLMTRRPWLAHELLGWPGLQIPYDPVAVVLEIGERFGATHLHLSESSRRPALRDLYEGRASDPRFELVAESGTEKLYRLRYPASPSRAPRLAPRLRD